jgi:hypothetical protein
VQRIGKPRSSGHSAASFDPLRTRRPARFDPLPDEPRRLWSLGPGLFQDDPGQGSDSGYPHPSLRPTTIARILRLRRAKRSGQPPMAICTANQPTPYVLNARRYSTTSLTRARAMNS